MNRKSAESILEELNNLYPHSEDSMNFLQFNTPFEILIMTILSAQTTDVTINGLHDELFGKYPDAFALANADPADVEQIVHPAGFFRAKTRNIIAASQMLVTEFNGEVPRTIEELTSLPGVGRKTANIVTNHAFHEVYGIAVDTHVARLSRRLGFSNNTIPEKIEQDLLKLLGKKWWAHVNYLLISHGRAVCTAKKPDCEHCILSEKCKSKI